MKNTVYNEYADEIKNFNQKIFPEIVEIRRHLHRFPELSFCEVNTAKFIRQKLEDIGIETDVTLGNNSVIGILRINSENNFIALRADTDALPIYEENDYQYKSVNQGVMHACGHDAHTASLLGTAMILKHFKEQLTTNILFIFQAAEEKNPGGAKLLIDNGLFDKYKIKKIIAQHVDPEVETGKFCFGKGILMASSDEIYVTFKGVGGHAALPQNRSDTILSAGHFLVGSDILQVMLNKKHPAIISFGKIIANGTTNIIPNETYLTGTMRFYEYADRNFAKIMLRNAAKKWAEKYKCSVDFEISEGYPCLWNDEYLYDEVSEKAKIFLGTENILDFTPRMGSEDFAFYSHKIPAQLYRSGIRGNGFGEYMLHNPKFDLDENFLLQASALMAFLVI
jgi:amidohydrolase